MILALAARFNFSGLAGAVGAEEGEDFAAVEAEADAPDGFGGGFALAVAFAEVLGFEDGHAGGVRRGGSIVTVLVFLGRLSAEATATFRRLSLEHCPAILIASEIDQDFDRQDV